MRTDTRAYAKCTGGARGPEARASGLDLDSARVSGQIGEEERRGAVRCADKSRTVRAEIYRGA